MTKPPCDAKKPKAADEAETAVDEAAPDEATEASSSAASSKGGRPPIVALAVVAGALAVAIVIIAIAVGRSNRETTRTETDETTGEQKTISEVQPVTVTGDALALLPESGDDPAVGTLTPELVGASFDGTEVRIGHDGRPKVIIFFAHWCSHCQAELPLVSQALRDERFPSEVDVMAISTDVRVEQGNFPPSEWFEDEEYPGPVLVDDEALSANTALGLSGYPFFVFVDAEGRVVARREGEQPIDSVVAAAEALVPVPAS